LQAEASACVTGLANVLFCGVAVSFFYFSHCKITTVVSFLRLVGNGQRYIFGRRKGTRNFPTVKDLLGS